MVAFVMKSLVLDTLPPAKKQNIVKIFFFFYFMSMDHCTLYKTGQTYINNTIITIIIITIIIDVVDKENFKTLSKLILWKNLCFTNEHLHRM
jgi:hypothetical protein